jgi:hypothetical protein
MKTATRHQVQNYFHKMKLGVSPSAVIRVQVPVIHGCQQLEIVSQEKDTS